MDGQEQRVGVGNGAEQGAPGACGHGLVPAKDRRPVGLPSLQRVMHQVPGHHGVLAPGVEVDAGTRMKS